MSRPCSPIRASRAPIVNDRVCQDLYSSLRCVLRPPADCHAYFARQNLTPGQVLLADLYERWDYGERDWSGWLTYAQALQTVVAVPAGEAMELAAIDAAIVTTESDPKALADISRVSDAVVAPIRPPELAAKASQVHALIEQPTECARFRAQWLADHPQ